MPNNDTTNPAKAVPPNNIEAEKSVLGAMMLRKEAISEVSELIGGNDFYRDAHRIIYDTIIIFIVDSL